MSVGATDLDDKLCWHPVGGSAACLLLIRPAAAAGAAVDAAHPQIKRLHAIPSLKESQKIVDERSLYVRPFSSEWSHIFQE